MSPLHGCFHTDGALPAVVARTPLCCGLPQQQPYLPDEVTGRVVPGRPPFMAASILAVPPRLLPDALRLDVAGRAKPVSGRPPPVMGRTAWLGPPLCAVHACVQTSCMVCIHAYKQHEHGVKPNSVRSS